MKAPICSEKLNDLYNYCKQFVEKKHPGKDILKKRSFKLALKTVLENQGFVIDELTTNLGVILIGIGLNPNFNNTISRN